MDEAIRALVRRTTDDEAAQAELDRACDRAGVELPREVVARLPRWRTTRWLVDGWFRRPLEAGPGGDLAQLEQAAQRLGEPLPRALREAWRLVGDRPELLLGAPSDWWVVEPGDRSGAGGAGIGPHLQIGREPADPALSGAPLVLDRVPGPDPRVLRVLPPDPTDDDPAARLCEAWPSIPALVVSRLLRAVWHELPRLRSPTDLFRDEVRRAFVHGPGFAALRTALEARAVPCPTGATFPLGLYSDDDTLLLADADRGLVVTRTPAAWLAVLERVNRFAPS